MHETRVRRRGIVPVAVLCAAFALGSTNSSACPASYIPLNNEDVCKGAAGVASRPYGDSGAYSYYPAGCYWHRVDDKIYFNSATGAANYYAQMLCAGAARSPAHCSARGMR
jgi:hypothetical protein